MAEAGRIPRLWFTFTGCALAIAILHWAHAILVPVAFAVLMAFVLAPVVTKLQHWIGRVPAVIAVAAFAFVVLGLVGWMVTNQLAGLVEDLPTYQRNLRQKILDLRGVSGGGSIEKLQNAVDEIQQDFGAADAPAPADDRMFVQPESERGLWGFPAAVGPLLGTFATAGLIVALVIFMLLERESLRDRMIRLFGHDRLIATTRAFDEAGWRVSRYLLVQSLVNATFGTLVGIGLFLIGMPYPLLWAVLGGALRYIPYVGPIVAALLPLLVALALEGWVTPLLVLVLFIALELFTNLVLETALFAGVAGISQVALLVAVAFWAWLWGPLGILLATPITVCLAVMGKHVPGLGFMTMLISDEPVLPPEVHYYQRLLAGDKAEAIEIIEDEAEKSSPEAIYDGIVLPALTFAERDRIEGHLSVEEERAVIEATRELLAECPVRAQRSEASNGSVGEPTRVLGIPANGEGDVVALSMLTDLLDLGSFSIELKPGNMLTSEILEDVQQEQREPYRAVFIVDLPPSAPSKSRHITRRLRAMAPDLPILVGRWAPPELADESADALLRVGATRVASTLLESRDQLLSLCR